MTESDRAEFYAIWVDAWEMHGKDPSPGVLALAFDVLSRFELHEVRRAMGVVMSGKTYGAPKPGELVEIIEGSADDRAMRAWTRVLAAIQGVGSYSSVAFDDPIIHAVIAHMGGWTELCRMTIDETPFRAQEFTKRYQGYARQRVVPPYPPVLTGHIAQDPRALEPDKRPALIGDQPRCLAVIEGGGQSRDLLALIGSDHE